MMKTSSVSAADEPWMGIDFGTCRSSAAVLIGAEPRAVKLGYGTSADMPTAVYVESDGSVLVGEEAVNARIKDPSRYRDRFKLQIANQRGVTVPVGSTDRTFSWAELIAAVLKRIRLAAQTEFNNGQYLGRATLTVPAIFTEGGPEWEVMTESARLAGFTQVRLIREPHAAAVYYDQAVRGASEPDRGGETRVTLVYDLGGGTFDPALIRRDSHGYSLVGANAVAEGIKCGGIFFDDRIRQDFRKKCPQAWSQVQAPGAAEAAAARPESTSSARRRAKDVIELENFLTLVKHRFSSPDVAEVNEPEPLTYETDYRLTRQEFYALIEPLLDETIVSCEALIRRTGTQWREIDRIIMVGGSCHIPLVRDKLQAMTAAAGAKVEICWRRVGLTDRLVDPHLAVCLGAALASDGGSPKPLADESAAPSKGGTDAAQCIIRGLDSILSDVAAGARKGPAARTTEARMPGFEIIEGISALLNKSRTPGR